MHGLEYLAPLVICDFYDDSSNRFWGSFLYSHPFRHLYLLWNIYQSKIIPHFMYEMFQV